MSKTEEQYYMLSFPHTGEVITNAQLKYMNIENLLADSKSDRSSKYHGFLICSYYDSADVLVLYQGDVINAVRYSQGACQIVSLKDAIDKTIRSSSGKLNLVKTDLLVIQMMLSSVYYTPICKRLPGCSIDLKKFIKFLNSRNWSGFLEVKNNYEINYLTIENGHPRKIFFSKLFKNQEKKFLSILADNLNSGHYYISSYSSIKKIVELKQAHPAQLDLFHKIYSVIFERLAEEIGPQGTYEMFLKAKEELGEEFPLLQKLTIDLRGNFLYNGIAESGTLTESYAALLQKTIVKLNEMTKIDSSEVTAEILKPYQVTLKSLGFYKYFSVK